MRLNDLDWPCHNVVPGMAPVAAILARTDQTVVAEYDPGVSFQSTWR